MADLTGKTLANGYPNLVTIGATTDDNPTSGTLENGKGNNLTSVTFDGAVVVNESGGNNDFRVEGDSEANLLFVDASADKVGIGTSSPATNLEISDQAPTVRISSEKNGSFTIGEKMASLEFFSADTSGSSANSVRSSIDLVTESTFGSTAALVFSTKPDASGDPTERVRIKGGGEVGIGKTPTSGIELDVNGEIRASGGILFGSDTAAANTLDDYEEGTWTPVYEPQTGSFTTMTMAVNSATYTKIGRQVTVQAWVKTSNVDVTGASGFLFIGGLPFTSLGSISVAGISVGNSTGWSSTANSPDSGVITASSTSIRLQKTNATAISVVSDLRTGAISDQNDLRFTATYFT